MEMRTKTVQAFLNMLYRDQGLIAGLISRPQILKTWLALKLISFNPLGNNRKPLGNLSQQKTIHSCRSSFCYLCAVFLSCLMSDINPLKFRLKVVSPLLASCELSICHTATLMKTSLLKEMKKETCRQYEKFQHSLLGGLKEQTLRHQVKMCTDQSAETMGQTIQGYYADPFPECLPLKCESRRKKHFSRRLPQVLRDDRVFNQLLWQPRLAEQQK